MLVTGGASGIGLAIAAEFLRRGARVLVADRDREGLARLRAPRGRLPPADGRGRPRLPGCSGAARRRGRGPLGGVDVLVNNAGLMRQTPALEITVAEWDELFGRQPARRLLPHPGGGAGDGRARGRRGGLDRLGERASDRGPGGSLQRDQGGIVSVMRSFATELGHRGLRFNSSPPARPSAPRRPPATPTTTATERGATSQRVPLRRVGLPEEMARVVCFLASDEASYVSGQTIVADGGELAGDWYDTSRRPPVPERMAGIDPDADTSDPDEPPARRRRPPDHRPAPGGGTAPLYRDRPHGRDLRGERPPAGRVADRARGDPDRRRHQPDRAGDDPGLRLGARSAAAGSSAPPSGSPRSARSTTSPSAPARPTCSSARSAATTSTCSR